MNGDNFYKWFNKILPLLNENAVIVMDNVSYHSVKMDPCPITSWKKADIINWLENKGEVVDHTKVKSELLERVQVLKP